MRATVTTDRHSSVHQLTKLAHVHLPRVIDTRMQMICGDEEGGGQVQLAQNRQCKLIVVEPAIVEGKLHGPRHLGTGPLNRTHGIGERPKAISATKKFAQLTLESSGV